MVLVIAPWVARGGDHPWATGWVRWLDPASRPAALPDAAVHAALDRVVDGLDPETPLALRWHAPTSPEALAFVWVTATYRQAPRPVFPLLDVDQIDALTAADRLHPRLAEALVEEAADVREGDGVAVVWGGPTPCRLPVPGLVAERRDGPLCLLKPDLLRSVEVTP